MEALATRLPFRGADAWTEHSSTNAPGVFAWALIVVN